MQVDGDGDTLPDNTATTLTEVEACVQADPGQTLVFDTYVNEISGDEDFSGYSYLIELDPNAFAVIDSTYGDPMTNLLASAPGSEVVVQLDAQTAGVLAVASNSTEAVPGPASGVLGRYVIDVLAEASPALYEVGLKQVRLLQSDGTEIQQADLPVGGQIAVSPSTCPTEPESPPTSSATPAPTATPDPATAPMSTPEGTPSPYSSPSQESVPRMAYGETTADDGAGRFLFPPLDIVTAVTTFFDHTSPRLRDGKIQIYTGAVGTKKDQCDPEFPSYFSKTAGRCLHYDGHAGYDYDLPNRGRVAVRAAAAGCAVEVGSVEAYGLRIVLRHYNGYETVYGHLDDTKPHISEDECVAAGDEIAFGANTGCHCGAHLHFEVLDPRGTPTDPYGWWGDGVDPLQPTSRWLWIVEQPITNGFAVPIGGHESAHPAGSSLTGGDISCPALSNAGLLALVIRSPFPCYRSPS